MRAGSTTAPNWAVSTHTDGEVLTAGVTGDHVDLVLLGIPVGFTASEIEGWLRDLAGVALETSRTDERARAIPALLHHTLTGLLFSHAELWSGAGADDPCSAVFVESPEGGSFGWVGPGSARVRIDGREYSPQWVHVRDDEGREARAAVLPPGVRAEVVVEHWPGGRDSGRAPITVEAEWGSHAAALDAPPAGAAGDAAMPPAHEPVAEAPAVQAEAPPAAEAGPVPPLPATLPVDQPGLLAHAEAPHAEPDAADIPAEAGLESAGEPARTPASPEPSALASGPTDLAPVAPLEAAEPPKPHPVARWLGRLLHWGQPSERPRSEPGRSAPEPEGLEAAARVPASGTSPLAEAGAEPPVSQYDLMLTTPEEDLAPQPREAPEAPPSPDARAPHAEVQASAGIPPEAPVAGVPSAPPAPAPAPGLLAPAGLEDILGGRTRDAAASAPPPAATSHPAPPSPVTPAAASVPAPQPLAVPEDPSTLPVLSVPLPPGAADAPVDVVHEPVGAHREQFAIPPLPEGRGVALSRPSLEAPLASDDPHAALLELPWLEPSRERDPAVREIGEKRRREWPAPAEEPQVRPRITRSTLALGAAVVVLFGAGWLVGSWQGQREGEPSMVERAFRAVGLGAPRFTAQLQTQPPGAWISVDGRELQRRTPADVELPPGEHQVTFSMPDLGEHVITVSGRKGERIPVDEPLHGSLEVVPADAAVPIQVSVDRKPLGYAPVTVESIEPGLHEVMFSGPGMPAWAQTVQVGIRRPAQVIAQPMTSPATGVLRVQATLDDEQGSSPLSGAQVFIDGELKGTTPLQIELQRGPHSIRVQWRGETAPIQVIDLPGGNQRFSTFAFGLDMEQPILRPVQPPRSIDARQPAVVSASLEGMSVNVVREAWLHVRTSEGLWRRSAMSVMRAPKGVVVSTVFPAHATEDQSAVRWYMSAVTLQGDEYFTDMQRTAISHSGSRSGSSATP